MVKQQNKPPAASFEERPNDVITPQQARFGEADFRQTFRRVRRKAEGEQAAQFALCHVKAR